MTRPSRETARAAVDAMLRTEVAAQTAADWGAVDAVLAGDPAKLARGAHHPATIYESPWEENAYYVRRAIIIRFAPLAQRIDGAWGVLLSSRSLYATPIGPAKRLRTIIDIIELPADHAAWIASTMREAGL